MISKIESILFIFALILLGALSVATVASPHYDKNDASYSISDGIPDN